MKTVYILTNECMPDIIKIGITDNLERRIKGLDNTSVALPFECYYAVELSDADAVEVEKKMHQGLGSCRIRERREFFNTTPEEARSLLSIAENENGTNVTPDSPIVEEPEDQQALNKARESRKRFNFGILAIDEGTTLEFKKDKTITCVVANDTQVHFQKELMSLSRSADLILKEMGYEWGSVHGPAYWCLNGKSLHDLRLEAE